MLLMLIYPLGAFPTTLEVSVTSAGNLVNQVDLAQIGQITSLTLHGELNGTDILVIRKMKGLEYLDMIDTKIVNGGDSYYEEYISSENTIGSYFFDNPSLSTVYLPNTITAIDDYAFKDFMSLENIFIPNSVTKIGDEAFKNCASLTEITIPNSVTIISFGAFENCMNLTKVTIEGGNPNSLFMGRYSFFNCPIEEVVLNRDLSYEVHFDKYGSYQMGAPFNATTLRSIKIGPLVTSIGPYLFRSCNKVEEVTIPKTISSIGDNAFGRCSSLKKLIIESGDAILGLKGAYAATFEDCPLEEIFLGRTLDYDDSESGVFEFKESLTSLTIGDKVTRISNYEFNNTSIESITIPNSVVEIGTGAFNGCRKLKKVNFEDGREELDIIPDKYSYITTFQDCPIESLYLGRSLSRSPFQGNTHLTSVVVGECSSIVSSAFSGCTGLLSVEISDSVLQIGGGAFENCSELTTFIFPKFITSISGDIFNGCNKLQSIDIPNSVITIGDGAFYGCESLRSVALPSKLTSIGSSAFSDCKGLTSVPLPDTLTDIGTSAFRGCVGLASIILPSMITSIEPRTFEGCVSLTSITLPYSVTSVGDYAFKGCVALTEINSLNTTPPVIKENTFDEVTYENAILNIPFGCKTIYWLHPYWENFYNILEKEFPTTGIAEVVSENSDCGYRLGGYGVTFTKDGEAVGVYTIQGTLIYSVKSSLGQTVELTPNTIYIIKLGGQTTKIVF